MTSENYVNKLDKKLQVLYCCLFFDLPIILTRIVFRKACPSLPCQEEDRRRPRQVGRKAGFPGVSGT